MYTCILISDVLVRVIIQYTHNYSVPIKHYYYMYMHLLFSASVNENKHFMSIIIIHKEINDVVITRNEYLVYRYLLQYQLLFQK